jgi:hypothetical protein
VASVNQPVPTTMNAQGNSYRRNCRQARISQAWEQNSRSLLTVLRGNHWPHPGAGHLAQAIRPAISAAKFCEMASMSLAGRLRVVN